MGITLGNNEPKIYLGDKEIYSGSTLITKNITANGTYDASDDDADGYSSVTVTVQDATLKALIDRSITSIEIPAGTTKIGYGAFYDCRNLTSVTIPSSCTVIDAYAFDNCRTLADIVLPQGLTTIGASAFRDCFRFAVVVIPDGVERIEEYSFYGCRGITSITLSRSLTYVGRYSMRSLTSATEIVFRALSPATVAESSAFNNLPTSCVIRVPYSADHSILNAYKTATNYPDPSTYTYVDDVIIEE